MKSNSDKSSRKLPARRHAPDITTDLQPLAAPGIFNDPEVVVRDSLIENLDLTNLSVKSIHFENCILQRVTFTRSKLPGLRLRDVRLIECDLGNAEAPGMTIVRTEFLNCRLTGFRAVEAGCQHLLISEGDAAYSQFRSSTFVAGEFNSCNFADADFQNSDLRGAVLKGCDFKNAEMTSARLDNADFRGSRVEGLVVNAEDLKGAIVDPAQAMVFAALMGLHIR